MLTHPFENSMFHPRIKTEVQVLRSVFDLITFALREENVKVYNFVITRTQFQQEDMVLYVQLPTGTTQAKVIAKLNHMFMYNCLNYVAKPDDVRINVVSF